MKKALSILISLVIAAAIVAPLAAKPKKPAKPVLNKVYLAYHALTTTYDYTPLRGTIAAELNKVGYQLVRSAQEADWTVQVIGTTGATLKTEFGAACFYTTDINIVILIDRGEYAIRIFETTLTEKGKHLIGFDEAAAEAYNALAPEICETIIQQLNQQ